MFRLYGQPACGAGASKVSTHPVRARATSAALSMQRHSVATMNNVLSFTVIFSGGPPRNVFEP